MAHRYDVFLSHSSADKPAVEKLAQKLVDAGLSPFLDKWHLIPGEPWQEALEEALDDSLTCAVFLGPTGIGPWQNEEMRSALADRVSNKAFRVIPVLLPNSFEPRKEDLPRFLRRLTWVDFRAGLEDEEAFRRLIHGIQGTAPGPSGSGGGVSAASISYRCMAQPPEGFIHRSEYEKVFEALCHKYGMTQAPHSVGITTALRGAGGFGKTSLAQAMCFDERIRRHYPDGIIWTTMGDSLDSESRLSRILDLIRWWTDTEPLGFKDLEAAGAKLREILNGRRVLVVLDDVWSPADVAPFRGLGNGSAVLITTRDRQTLPVNSIPVDVDAMAPREAVSLLRSELPKGQDREFALLAAQLGEWPLLLKLVNRQLRDLMNRDDLTISDALREIHLALNDEGFSAFDQNNPEARHAAASRTILVSVRRLSEKERDLYFQLAVFPEEAEVPISLLEGYWQLSHFATRKLCGRLYDLSLLRDFENRTIRLHDVIRKILIEQVETKLPTLHARLLDSHRPASGHWADLAEENQYLWRNLAGHLLGADRVGALRELLADFSFLEAKLKATDVNTVISDYAVLAEEDQGLRLIQDAIRLSAHILGRDKRQLAAQLLGRLLNRREEYIRRLTDGANSWHCDLRLRPKTASFTQPGGALIRTIEGHMGRIRAVAAVDAQRIISASADSTLRVWDLKTGESVSRLEGHSGWVNAVAVIDSRRAISASADGSLKLWDLESGKTLRSLEGHSGWVNGVAVIDGRRIISASDDRTLRVWNFETGELLASLEGHSGWVNAVAVVDGYRAISASYLTLKLWDLENRKVLRSFAGHLGRVLAVAAVDGRRAISASADRTLKLWDLEDGKLLRSLEGHSGRVLAAVVIDGRRALSAADDGTLRIWDLETGESLQCFESYSGKVRAMAVVNSRQAIFGDDQTLRIWDLENEATLHSPKGHAGRVGAVAVLQDQWALSGSDDRTLRLWDVQTGEALHSFPHSNWVRAVAFLDDRRAFSSDDTTLKLWDLETGKALLSLSGHSGGILAVAVEGQRAISGCEDGSLWVWRLETGEAIQSLKGHLGAIHAVALLDGGGRAISASDDRTLRVWDLKTGETLLALKGHLGSVLSVAVVDCKRAVSASADRTLLVWDLETGKPLRSLEGHLDVVHGVAVVDRRRVASASADGTLRVWDLESGETVDVLALDAPLLAVAVGMKGRTIVAGDQSGGVHFFDWVVPE